MYILVYAVEGVFKNNTAFGNWDRGSQNTDCYCNKICVCFTFIWLQNMCACVPVVESVSLRKYT